MNESSIIRNKLMIGTTPINHDYIYHHSASYTFHSSGKTEVEATAELKKLILAAAEKIKSEEV